MTEIRITSDHPEAVQLVKAALDAYAIRAQVHAVQCRERQPHPGETREQLDRRALRLDERAAAVEHMLTQIPGGQAGLPTT